MATAKPTIRISPASGVPGQRVRVSGRGPVATAARLQRRDKKRWTELAVSRTNGRGQVRFDAFLPEGQGRVRYRVRFAAGAAATASARIVAPREANPRTMADFVSDASDHPSQQVMDGVLYFAGWIGDQQGLWKQVSPTAPPELIWGATATGESGPFASMRLAVGGRVYFDFSGQGWVTDGTTSGTVKLTDYPVSSVVAVGREVLIHPDRTTEPTFRSDGTPAGTVRYLEGNETAAPFADGDFVLDMRSWRCLYGPEDGTYVYADFGNDLQQVLGSADCEAPYVDGIRFAGRQWFGWSATSAQSPTLWSTDGTPAGTRQELGPNGAPVPATERLIATGGLLYIQSRTQLWATDGTAAGTSQVTGVSLDAQGIQELTPYQGGLIGSGLKGSGFVIPAGGRVGREFPTSSAPPLAQWLAWGALLLGENDEYDGFDGEYDNKLYLWDPSRPAGKAAAGVAHAVNKRTIGLGSAFVFELRAFGALLPQPGDRISVLIGGKVVDRLKTNTNYAVRYRLPARTLGAGRHLVTFRYDGGTQLLPSPPDEVVVRVRS